LDLKQSPLTVDLQKPPSTSPSAIGERMEISSFGSGETIQERRDKRRSSQDDEDDQSKRRSSLTIVRDFVKSRRNSVLSGKSPSTDNLVSPGVLSTSSRSPSGPPSTHQTSGLARRLSISSRRSSMSRERDMPKSPTNTTDASGSGDEPGSISGLTADKKSGTAMNRTSRFIRRLSNTITSSRKNMAPHISPTVTEEDTAELAAASQAPRSRGAASLAQEPSIVEFMGDVNVQFPDNLLWKRRSLSLDSQGFLLLSAVQGAGVGGATAPSGVKRYHLSEFRAPYTPEIEVQELPNSVCLDFVEGSGLQIACEDRAGQMNVLKSKYTLI
jgi:hypothetical protein